MAVGKSTVGPLVAELLSMRFVDLDRVVEQEAGMDIGTLFRCEAESAFRQRESLVLGRVLGGGPSVLALGGGTLHHGRNLEALQDWGEVVVLSAPLEVVLGRLGSGRPLAARAVELFEARRDLYQRAGAQVSTEGRAPAEVARAVIEVLG